MSHPQATELKPFVPARDFDLSRRFYTELGFEEAWRDDSLACFRAGGVSFLLQNFYVREFADNLMLHLLVPDVESWRAHVRTKRIAEVYGVKVSPVMDQPWRMRDFTLIDPSGVLWRIAQNID
jgi:hypothetical protein